MANEKEVIGRIIGISELNVKVLLFNESVKLNDILTYEDEDGIRKFEVVQIDNNVASTVKYISHFRRYGFILPENDTADPVCE